MDRITDIASAQRILDRSEYIRMLGIKILELDGNHAKGQMPFDGRYLNPAGTMHGGCLYSLADTVAGTLAEYAGCDVTTVEGGMNFLEAAADTEYVYCIAQMKRCGKHLVTVEATITNDEGRLLDCGLFTFFRFSDAD